MALDRFLLESGAPDGYLLEDGTGVLLIDYRNPTDVPGLTLLIGGLLVPSTGNSVTVTPSGGWVFADGVLATRVAIPVATGGAVFADSAIPVRNTTLPVSGGYLFDGTVVGLVAKTPVPSGGILLESTSVPTRVAIPIPTDGIYFAGIADVVIVGSNILTVTPSGGVIFNGAAGYLLGEVIDPTGGMDFNGTVSALLVAIQAPSGGYIFGGAATVTTSGTAPPPAPDERTMRLRTQRAYRFS